MKKKACSHKICENNMYPSWLVREYETCAKRCENFEIYFFFKYKGRKIILNKIINKQLDN